MKLIIDVPEYDYEHIREYYEKNDIVEGTYSYIYYGTPIPDNATVCDIEQIRAEIEYMRNKVKPLDDFSDRGMYADGKIAAYDYVLQIIDNYTKGENK